PDAAGKRQAQGESHPAAPAARPAVETLENRTMMSATVPTALAAPVVGPPIIPPPIFGRISGVKYNDLNANGVRDAGEPGLANWRIYLDANNNGALDAGERNTLTGATGAYSFNVLPPGTYHVREVQQAGWRRTA